MQEQVVEVDNDAVQEQASEQILEQIKLEQVSERIQEQIGSVPKTRHAQVCNAWRTIDETTTTIFQEHDARVHDQGKVDHRASGSQEPETRMRSDANQNATGDPRNTRAWQVRLKIEEKGKALELGKEPEKELEEKSRGCMRAKTEEGVHVVCEGRRLLWRELEEDSAAEVLAKRNEQVTD